MPTTLKLDWATHEAAKYACQHWHYSKCMPAGKSVKIGVWEDGSYIGVIVFSMGSGNATRGDKYGLKPKNEVAELGRVALDSHKSPVSKMISIAIRLLHEQSPKLRLLISFADRERMGHHGGIYQAGNWIYSGDSATDHVIVIFGERVHRRSVYAKYGINSLEWVKKNVDSNAHFLSNIKHRYLMPLDKEMRKRIEPLAQPYPKRVTKASTSQGEAAEHSRPTRSNSVAA